MASIKNFFKKLRLLNLVTIILLVVVFMQILDVSKSIADIESENNSYITEIGQVKEALFKMQDAINEPRNLMGFDKINIVNFDDEIVNSGSSSENSDSNKDELQLKLFDYIDYISASQVKDEKNILYASFINGLQNSETFNTLLSNKNLKISDLTDSDAALSVSLKNQNDAEIVKLFLDKEQATLLKKTPLSKDTLDFANYADFESALISDINQNFEIYTSKAEKLAIKKAQISEVLNSEEVLTFANENNLSFSEISEKELSISFSVLLNTTDTIASITLNYDDLLFALNDLNDSENQVTADDLSNSLIPFLKNTTKNISKDVSVKNKVEQIQSYLQDSGFVATMEKSGITISFEPIEDDTRIYFKIFDKDKNHISSIVIEKATDVVNIVDPDGNNSKNLLYFDPEGDKKKIMELPDYIPEYGDSSNHEDNTFNILIAGKNGNLMDTMIFTHINETDKTVRMVSIPRDLFYNGRKINSFAYFYGMDELKNVLSDMTGYKLDKFILIDMYAFIDVIDLIGGIDVHLDNAVIDPTYVTEDNGVWGTLHYEPGDYHFSGKQALRVARSRHTSSDFARADRQQIIIESIQLKARNMGFGDADTLYNIAKTVLSKTDTDINIEEAIRYYFKYQNYDIISNNVMSSGNVLYVPPYVTTEQCAARVAQAEENGEAKPGCENENHAYTLLPRDNNWNVVKWFFEENFESEV